MAQPVWCQFRLDSGDDPPPLAPEVAADAIASLANLQLRDLLIAWLTPGTIDLEQFPAGLRALLPDARTEPDNASRDETWSHGCRLQARLIALARLTPDSHAAPPLTVLASFAWWRGDGSLARLALDGALTADPGYRLAALLDLMVVHGIRPVA